MSNQTMLMKTGSYYLIHICVAALVGYACQRQLGLPRVLGYAAVGSIAGFFGLGAALWPLHGPVLLLLELGIARLPGQFVKDLGIWHCREWRRGGRRRSP